MRTQQDQTIKMKPWRRFATRTMAECGSYCPVRLIADPSGGSDPRSLDTSEVDPGTNDPTVAITITKDKEYLWTIVSNSLVG